MTFNELIENVKGWSIAKGLDKASPLSQMLKLNEEWGELNSATVRNDKEKVADSIGDMMVVLTILAQQMEFSKIHLELNPDENSQHSYYCVDEWPVEVIYLYIAKEIGLIASSLIDISTHLSRINSRTQIQVSSRNIAIYLMFVAQKFDLTLTECLEIAWNEIKDRQGKMVDGVFVKAADLEEVQDGKQ
ncbi:MazG-like family protein [Streptococcus azizii]|uniref:Phosphoribosyl-ATP diphosphatase n=1 Tax=Streptococcus azizii TaxID=1579424 RepID=A0AB36JNB2_9STRE|nr:MazG-like family protein [Streptococcus azizii]ONK25710.1 phosphoribosyl-ATP diphosphatase [Streptococcus azizii]